MGLISIDLAALLKWLTDLLSKPKLSLLYNIYPDTKLIPGVGNVRLLLKNTSRCCSRGGTIVLKVYKPRHVYPGKGLLFNEQIGSLGQQRHRIPGEMIQDAKPKTYQYRLNPEVFLDKHLEPIEIVCLPKVAFDYRDAEEKFDIDIAWQVFHPGMKPQNGRIVLSGEDVKRILLSNVKPLSVRVSPPEDNT